MASQTWTNLLNNGAPWQTTQGVAVTTSTAGATLSQQAAGPKDFVLPVVPYVGLQLRVLAQGTLTTGATTASFTWALGMGVNTNPVTVQNLCTTAAVVMGGTSIGPLVWDLNANIVFTALGSSGNTVASNGGIVMGDSTTPALVTANAVMVNMPWLATAIDTTASLTLALRCVLSASFGSYQCNTFTIEQLS
jgi:hypothetical protein